MLKENKGKKRKCLVKLLQLRVVETSSAGRAGRSKDGDEIKHQAGQAALLFPSEVQPKPSPPAHLTNNLACVCARGVGLCTFAFDDHALNAVGVASRQVG
jgi:hypothetical protein